ncbi:MAG: diacylglycerol/lipid kinase family protein [Desulfitobacteriia bacterium]|jgi:diacylglycerol kinase (ATP)
MKLSEKWFAVVNPSSANGKTRSKWPYYYQDFLQGGIEMDYAFTTAQANGVEVTRQALQQGYRRIIAVGGDGTVNEVLNGFFNRGEMIRKDLELAVFAQGTGCDFIRTLQIDKGITSFIRILKDKSPSKVDVGLIALGDEQNEKKIRYFLNAANLGIGAEVVDYTNNRTKALGSRLSYLTGTISTLKSYRNFRGSCSLDQGKITFEGKFCGLMICNGRYIGGGMKIAPQAEINDGYFDLIVIKDISKLKLLSHFSTIYQGRHIELPEVAVYRCQELSINTPNPILLEADGEIIGHTPSEFRIIPQCLNIYI